MKDPKISGATSVLPADEVHPINLAVNPRLEVATGAGPKFEKWDMTGFKYYPRVGMFKFIKPEEKPIDGLNLEGNFKRIKTLTDVIF